jgi:hypothetical protein
VSAGVFGGMSSEDFQASLPRSRTMDRSDLSILYVDRARGRDLDGERSAEYIPKDEPLSGRPYIVPHYIESGWFLEANAIAGRRREDGGLHPAAVIRATPTSSVSSSTKQLFGAGGSMKRILTFYLGSRLFPFTISSARSRMRILVSLIGKFSSSSR